MKIILSLFLTISALSFNAHAAETLKPSNKKIILNLMQRVCYDTWCEGDYEFEFLSMTKLKHTDGYQVNFQIRSDEEKPWYRSSCEFEGRTQFAEYVISRKTLSSLTDEVYEIMTECVANAESQASEKYPIEPSVSGTKEICVPGRCTKD